MIKKNELKLSPLINEILWHILWYIIRLVKCAVEIIYCRTIIICEYDKQIAKDRYLLQSIGIKLREINDSV